uniref:Uncharacterized protein n=1 Tax=Aegilops tauschii subsp. strangulata TaxID=200361 RepID=A0A453GXP1_AEGTS
MSKVHISAGLGNNLCSHLNTCIWQVRWKPAIHPEVYYVCCGKHGMLFPSRMPMGL